MNDVIVWAAIEARSEIGNRFTQWHPRLFGTKLT